MHPALVLLSGQSQESPSRAEEPGPGPRPAVGHAGSYCSHLPMWKLKLGRGSGHTDATVWLLSSTPECLVTLAAC